MSKSKYFMIKIVGKHDEDVKWAFIPKQVGEISSLNNLECNDQRNEI